MAVLAGLVLAQGALAAPNTASIAVSYSPPKLGSSSQTTIHFTVATTSDAVAAANIFTKDTPNLGAAAGTTIGTVDATAIAHDQGGLTLPLSGNVVADDPAKHTTDPCSPGANQAVWNMNLSVAGQTLVVPVYVNRTSGAENQLRAWSHAGLFEQPLHEKDLPSYPRLAGLDDRRASLELRARSYLDPAFPPVVRRLIVRTPDRWLWARQRAAQAPQP